MSVFLIPPREMDARSAFDAVSVRAKPTYEEVWPTTIVEDGRGELVYGDDVPGKVWLGTRTLLRRAGDTMRSVDAFRFEVRFDAASSQSAAEGRTVVVAEAPRSVRRVLYAPVRAAHTSHRRGGRGTFEDLKSIENPADLDDRAALAAVEALPWDYWETGRDLVAGFSMPGPYVSPAQIPDPDRREDWMPHSTQRAGAALAFGLIHDPHVVLNAVLSSSEWKRLDDVLEKGWFRPPVRVAGLPDRIPLHKSVGHNLLQHLEIASRQAAAGPMRVGDDWRGRSVVGVALAHFMTHVYDANRRAASEAPDSRVIEIPFEDWDGQFVADGRVRTPPSDG